jgi:Dyp-type peroxidase family
MKGQTPQLELDDIQALALRAHADLPAARYLFLEFLPGPAASAWLRGAADRVTPASRVVERARHGTRPRARLQLAFTASGLAALGLPGDALDELPVELREGMHDPTRAARLGDDGASAPATWQFGGTGGDAPAGRLHAVLFVYAADDVTLAYALADERRRLAGAATVLHEERASDLGGKEHFGFADGIAQPYIAGDPRPAPAGQDPVAAGEMILGYDNELDAPPWTISVSESLPGAKHLPHVPPAARMATGARAGGRPCPPGARRDLGRNGTYLALRKLRQDVTGFWRFFAEHATRVPVPHAGDPAVYLASKAIGRWPSGAPLVLSPWTDSPSLGADPDRRDDFLYDELDARGLRCPFGSHIRRSNPRDSRDRHGGGSISAVRHHRIARRGRPYGPPHADPRGGVDDGVERGVLFVAMCTNLKRQFEFVQEIWLRNGSFAAMRDEPDPVIGGGGPRAGFCVPMEPFGARLDGMARFVEVRGGTYLFLPGRRALRCLGDLA